MRRSDVRGIRGGSLLAWAAALAGAAGVAGAQTLEIRSLHIESTPSAAEVELIGGPAGRTPLTISERDIYPNHYPDARAELYGMVVLRHPRCTPLRHRVTLRDIEQGLRLRLDCDADVEAAKAPLVAHRPAPGPSPAPPTSATMPAGPTPPVQPIPPAAPAPAAPAPAPATPSETVSQRRLRQLQVLQELLDEGLLSPAEEQRVRRRIVQDPTGP